MTDPLVLLLAPVLLLAVVLLLRFIGCGFSPGRSIGQPTLNPPPGTYPSPLLVTLSADSGLTILYTTDGTSPAYPPSGSTQQYAGTPIKVPSTGAIYAIAVETDGSTSGEVGGPYNIENMVYVARTESNDAQNATSVATAAFPSVAAGNLIVVWVFYESLVPITTQVADTTGVNQYFRALPPTQGSTGFTDWWQEIWYAKVQQGAPSTNIKITGTFSALVGHSFASAHQYSGSSNTDPANLQEPFDVAAGQANQGGTPTSGTVTTGAARLIFGAAIFDANKGDPGPGFVVRSTIDGCVAEDQVGTPQSPPVGVEATFDISRGPTQRWIAQVATFK